MTQKAIVIAQKGRKIIFATEPQVKYQVIARRNGEKKVVVEILVINVNL